MAFQTLALPSFAAVATELWPSMSNALSLPFRTSTSPLNPKPTPSSTRAPKLESSTDAQSQQRTPSAGVEQSKLHLPEFLQDSRLDAAVAVPRYVRRYVPSVLNIQNSISSLSRDALLASNPVVRRLYPLNFAMCPLSTTVTSRAFISSSPILRLAIPQRRSFQTGGGVTRSMLPHLEAGANRNPNSATAQSAFYTALLRANMPAIVIERYQSGRFATNAACDEAYQKALNMLNPGATQSNDPLVGKLPSGLTPTQIEAVKAAAAARSGGGNINVGSNPTVDKNGRVPVYISVPLHETVFKWFKFILWFGLVIYLILVLASVTAESISVLKRPGQKLANAPAKAEQQKVKFSDVHGCDDAKEELQEMVDFLRNPEKFNTLGGKLPKGVLLVGPPGTGKTLLARAVAGESGVPFFYMSGSEFDEIYVGVGAKRVRELFAAAKAKSPAIIFIDELDAIGGKRSGRDAVYIRQTLNQLLTEMDGFEQNSGVILIGATNFPEALDKALTRPGRFDRHVNIDLPDVRGRIAILEHHAKKIKAAKDVDLKKIAATTGGLSGAELENIVNLAAVHASRAKATSVGLLDFEWAKDRVIMGAEKKTMVISPKEKEMTAYHEAGHALIQLFSANAGSSLYKVTVLARGGTLGHTAYTPEMDKYSQSISNYRARIDTALGGKIAEEIAYGSDNVTSGAYSDLKQATAVAFAMVAQFGMSAKLGQMEYATRYEHLSSETKAQIESEVQGMLNESYERCRKLLMSRRKELDRLAQALVEYETLDKAEVERVIRGEKLTDRIALPKNTGMVVPVPEKPELGVPGEGKGHKPPTPTPPAPPSPGGLSSPSGGKS